MRILLGIILGAILTVGGAYLYDSQQANAAAQIQASAPRALVNWDVVDARWHALTGHAKAEWKRFAG
jgi:hypothetical protein